jgi:hypothetical protein
MKTTRITIAIVSLLMAVYFLLKRSDIIRELFRLGFNAVPIGQLLLPIILLIIGIVLLSIKNKKND